MPLFMDIHTLEGPVSAGQAAGAHHADLQNAGPVRRRLQAVLG
jgi:hypothetical protein